MLTENVMPELYPHLPYAVEMSDTYGTVTTGTEVSYGPDVSSDAHLRVCGDVRGKRVMELGIFGTTPNSIPLARKGARTIAVDPSASRISQLRVAAERAEVVVECHENGLADLGFAMSASLDLVLCVHQLHIDDDIPRLLRNVHRVLKTEAGFVLAIEHPASAMFDGHDAVARRPYGESTPAIGELVMSLQRANFSIDAMYELANQRLQRPLVPSTLVLRAHKLGS